MVKRIPLDTVCAPKIPTVSPQYDGIIDYVDISAVDNTEKCIVNMQCISAKEAPSRAKQLLEVGDILVSTVRPNLNAVAMVEQQTDNLLVGSTDYYVLRCSDIVDKRYVFYFCQSPYFVDDMTSQATGASYPAVSSGIVKSSTIPHHPIEMQKQIADRLDKVSELITLRKEQIAKLDQLVKSRFIELFGGISDSKRYPYKAVKELTDVISGGTPSREVNEYWECGTIPWVKTTELQNNIITEIDEHITEAGLDNSSAKLVPAGTVLIAMYGQGKTRGMTGYLGVEACTNQACACILPSDSINQKFLWQFFVLSYDNLRDMAKGGNQPNLNGNIIKNYPVLYPPMELQGQFATFVEQTDKSKLAIQQSLDKLELLKKSLMQEYFG